VLGSEQALNNETRLIMKQIKHLITAVLLSSVSFACLSNAAGGLSLGKQMDSFSNCILPILATFNSQEHQLTTLATNYMANGNSNPIYSITTKMSNEGVAVAKCGLKSPDKTSGLDAVSIGKSMSTISIDFFFITTPDMFSAAEVLTQTAKDMNIFNGKLGKLTKDIYSWRARNGY